MEIRCFDAQGNAVLVPQEEITFRPAVYGIFLEEGAILLMRRSDTGLFLPPGKILDSHEAPKQTIRHLFREVTNVLPVPGPLLFVEDLYHVDRHRKAWHLSVLYYALERPTAVSTPLVPHERDVMKAEWVKLPALKREAMQFGYEAVKAAELRLSLKA